MNDKEIIESFRGQFCLFTEEGQKSSGMEDFILKALENQRIDMILELKKKRQNPLLREDKYCDCKDRCIIGCARSYNQALEDMRKTIIDINL